jgi:hypothetical protein
MSPAASETTRNRRSRRALGGRGAVARRERRWGVGASLAPAAWPEAPIQGGSGSITRGRW